MPRVKQNWQELEKKYYMRTFNRQPLVLVRGEGVRVWDEEGRSYLDMVAGLAVNVLGHSHPAVVEALTNQAQQLIHTTNLYYTIPQLELAELLVENSPADRIFFANSGAEANEGALKLARRWGGLNRNGAYEVITAENSFHGRTLATLAATGQPKYHKPFEPMPAGFTSVPFNDLDALKAATGPQTCAVMLEVVQGESGVHLANREYLRGVRAWCDEQGLLLIFDEIQAGLGRTGKWLSFEHYGVEPDIYTLAKGLAGGVPIGAFLAKEHASVFGPGDHGSTFGGGPLACAAGVATVRTIFEQRLAEHSAEMGAYTLEKLRELQARNDVIDTIRGLGLMVAFDLKTDSAPTVVAEALKRGLILNATGPRTVRMVPPLILTRSLRAYPLSFQDKGGLVIMMWQGFIQSNPDVMMGKPVIAGTRITVEFILDKLAAGETVQDILDAHPHLTEQGIRAALAFASDALRADVVYPIAS